MAMLSNLDLIRRVPLFSRLTDAQAAAVSGAIVKRRYKRGENIVEQGKEEQFPVHHADGTRTGDQHGQPGA